MKMSRGVSLVGLSAAVVSAGWVMGSDVFTPPQSTALAAHTVTGAGTTTTGAGTPTASTSTSPTSSATTPATTPATSATASATPAAPPPPAAPSGTFDGSPVNTRYGTFQAEITVANGKITDIALLQDGARDGNSRSINAYAVPRLTKEVLSAQSANVQAISGASYTSGGFLETVASAIATAGLS